MKETIFALLAFEWKKRRMGRERFTAKMETAVPRGDRPPMPLATIPRVYFMQQRYAPSDRAMGNAVYEVESTHRFAGLRLKRRRDAWRDDDPQAPSPFRGAYMGERTQNIH